MELPVHIVFLETNLLSLVIFMNYWCSCHLSAEEEEVPQQQTSKQSTFSAGLSPDVGMFCCVIILKYQKSPPGRAHSHAHTHNGILTDGNFLPWHSADCHCAPFPAKSEPAEPATHVPLGGAWVILSLAAGRHGVLGVRSDAGSQDLNQTRGEVSPYWCFTRRALRQ